MAEEDRLSTERDDVVESEAEQAPTGIKAALAIGDSRTRLEALAAMVPRLVELPTEALAAMVPQLIELPTDTLGLIWKSALHRSIAGTRPDVLTHIRVLAPLIARLGGAKAVAAAIHSIQDVAGWWP